MTTYILVLFLFKDATMTHMEYDSQVACVAALRMAEATMPGDVKGFCSHK